MTPTPVLRGQSGCSIELVVGTPGLSVRKTSPSAAYDTRLRLQAEKQASFSHDGISVPAVTESCRGPDGRWSVVMRYCHHDNAIDFLQAGSPAHVSAVTHRLLRFIDASVEAAASAVVPVDAIRAKCDDVCSRVGLDVVRRASSSVVAGLGGCRLMPIGPCHGDLSLSNVLIGPTGELTFIDFLDVFIDTPLHDVVKLRQDTRHRWSHVMYGGTFDRHRVGMLLDVMDDAIDAHMRRYDWYVRLYRSFQLLNFMRILQYCDDERRVTWATETLEQLLTTDV